MPRHSPDNPEVEVKTRYSGIWNHDEVARYLHEQCVPLRLGCLTRSGAPLVVSLWFCHIDDALWCATQADSSVAGYLTNEPRCGFEIGNEAPPYAGVRGQGRAELLPTRGPEILEQLIERYVDEPDGRFARWLRSRSEQEVAIRIVPSWIFSWDFASRMKSSPADA